MALIRAISNAPTLSVFVNLMLMDNVLITVMVKVHALQVLVTANLDILETIVPLYIVRKIVAEMANVKVDIANVTMDGQV